MVWFGKYLCDSSLKSPTFPGRHLSSICGYSSHLPSTPGHQITAHPPGFIKTFHRSRILQQMAFGSCLFPLSLDLFIRIFNLDGVLARSPGWPLTCAFLFSSLLSAGVIGIRYCAQLIVQPLSTLVMMSLCSNRTLRQRENGGKEGGRRERGRENISYHSEFS